LRELQIEYDNSVGHNANLLLGVTPDFTGSLPAAHVARYTEFGDWIRGCYGQHNILAEKKGVKVQPSRAKSVSIVLPLPLASSFDRLWIMEDISQGQKIAAFTLEIQQVRKELNDFACSVSRAEPCNQATGFTLAARGRINCDLNGLESSVMCDIGCWR
jgi:alpha-L-fucosidase